MPCQVLGRVNYRPALRSWLLLRPYVYSLPLGLIVIISFRGGRATVNLFIHAFNVDFDCRSPAIVRMDNAATPGVFVAPFQVMR